MERRERIIRKKKEKWTEKYTKNRKEMKQYKKS